MHILTNLTKRSVKVDATGTKMEMQHCSKEQNWKRFCFWTKAWLKSHMTYHRDLICNLLYIVRVFLSFKNAIQFLLEWWNPSNMVFEGIWVPKRGWRLTSSSDFGGAGRGTPWWLKCWTLYNSITFSQFSAHHLWACLLLNISRLYIYIHVITLHTIKMSLSQ